MRMNHYFKDDFLDFEEPWRFLFRLHSVLQVVLWQCPEPRTPVLSLCPLSHPGSPDQVHRPYTTIPGRGSLQVSPREKSVVWDSKFIKFQFKINLKYWYSFVWFELAWKFSYSRDLSIVSHPLVPSKSKLE